MFSNSRGNAEFSLPSHLQSSSARLFNKLKCLQSTNKDQSVQCRRLPTSQTSAVGQAVHSPPLPSKCTVQPNQLQPLIGTDGYHLPQLQYSRQAVPANRTVEPANMRVNGRRIDGGASIDKMSSAGLINSEKRCPDEKISKCSSNVTPFDENKIRTCVVRLDESRSLRSVHQTCSKHSKVQKKRKKLKKRKERRKSQCAYLPNIDGSCVFCSLNFCKIL